MRNAEIAGALLELGDLYELDGAVVHRVLAYRTAAKAVAESPASVADMVRAGRAEELPGIGRTLAEKLSALVETGTIPAAEKLRAKYPPGLIAITRIPGFGPKKARKLFDELGVTSLEELRVAAESERLRTVPGFGRKAEENVLAALAEGADGRPRPRTLISKARAIAEELVGGLAPHPAAARVEAAGSVRRWAETCKDLDIVAASDDPASLVEAFAALPLMAEVLTSGDAGAKAITHNGMAVDLRIVAARNFGNLLQHFTGSKAHNEALRAEAVRRGIHVSEYGVTVDETGITHACEREEDVYALLGMDYIEPELRENRGELQAARAGELPRLVGVGDIRGDLHCHTRASDGRNTIREMALAARERGYEYLAITDHSASHGFGNEVSPEALREHMAAVRRADAEIEGIRLLAGSEVNVLPDGTLDYEFELLEALDWVVASVHTAFRVSEEEMTARMIRAAEHPLVDVIGHPTGRLIERREPYAVDVERLAAAAARTGTFLEINANPDRRDLNEVNARAAADLGVTLLVDSDAHGTETFANIAYGIATARRAWLGPEQIANTRSWPELDATRKRAARARA